MLYLIRHATSDQPMLREPGDLRPATAEEWALDHPLSARGREEALELGRFLARLEPPNRILASPRRRTQETLHLALAAHPERESREPRFDIDARLHEWHEAESCDALHARSRALLAEADGGVVWAFTHGGFIRAVVAAVQVGDDDSRYASTFHDLRRTLNVWNASVTLVAHGASGLELFAVNVCPAIDRLLGRP